MLDKLIKLTLHCLTNLNAVLVLLPSSLCWPTRPSGNTQRCCNAAQPLDFFASCCSRLTSPNDPHASVTNHLCHLRVKVEREAEEEGASLKRR